MHNFSPIKQNIFKFIEFKGITKYQFYKNTGISRGVLDKNSGLSEDSITKVIAYYSEINPEWLVTSNGPMLRTGYKNEELNIDTVNEKKNSYNTTCHNCELKDKLIHNLEEILTVLNEQLTDCRRDKEIYRKLLETNNKIID